MFRDSGHGSFKGEGMNSPNNTHRIRFAAPGDLGRIGRGLLSIAAVAFLLSVGAGCVTTTKPANEGPNLQELRALQPPPATPVPQAGGMPTSEAPTGSLYQANARSLFQDLKARKIGDVVTITVSEESNASKAATTSASKDKTFAGEFTFDGVSGSSGKKKGAAAFGPYSGTFGHSFKGDGSTTKTDSMTAYMTATVVDVLPNGNLFIRGSRWTKVNNEMQQIIVEGVIRPTDISRSNTVLSQNVAEAKIFFVGKGPVTQQQKPGWVGQILDAISPF